MNIKNKDKIIASAIGGLIIGFVIALVNPGIYFWVGFLTSTVIGFISIFVLLWIIEKLEGNKQVLIATFIAFAFRLMIGVLLFVLLPTHGYDEPYNNTGYLYLDAYRRDADAWQLANSDEPITAAFQAEFSTDQYGGLLSLSAFIYRFLSPDAHRPLLILIITSFFSALGVPFLWRAISTRWNKEIANASMWILALYPESIILGASQMREPILIGLSAIAFWGVTFWKTSKRKALIAIILSIIAMVFISSKAAAAILAAIAVWFWVDIIYKNASKQGKMISWIFIAILLAVGVLLSWEWLVDSSRWDILLMESASGRIQWELELLGEKFQAPFIISYGLAQPVLPAAIMYPGIPLTRAVAIFRALGWYILVPLMLAGFILVWRRDNKKDRRILLLFFAICAIWTIVSSARAGGDQWDNPRYRSIFLVWMAFTAGWSWVETIQKRSFWLWQLLLIEVIYIGFFIQWYLDRYYNIGKRMDFLPMVRLLIIIGIVIIGGGIILELIRHAQNKRSNS